MDISIRLTIGLGLFLMSFSIYSAQGELKFERGKTLVEVPAMGEGLCVSNVFQSGMVLQRDKEIHVWGWAKAGEEVRVSFAGENAKATAGADRSWRVSLSKKEANAQGQSMVIEGKSKTITLEDILVGDIWVLGGQSNMEFDIQKVVGGELEIASANFPKIRHMTVPQLDGPEMRKDFPKQYKWIGFSGGHFKQGYWEVCNPQTVRALSAIGYIFARRLHMVTQVPVGVIDLSRGGTTVETWTPLDTLKKIDGQETQDMLKGWDERVASFDPSSKNADPKLDMNHPGNCYASMMAPLKGLNVKGAIFHQGYNNCFHGSKGARMYFQVFEKMIESWREALGDPKLPFGIISLCTSGPPQDHSTYIQVASDIGAEIREAQYKTFLKLKEAGDKNIGFASSFDQRRSFYHPQIKIPVGERIAKWALATQFGFRFKWEPTLLKETELGEGQITLTFNDNLSAFNNGPLYGFSISGEDKRFYRADMSYGEYKDKQGNMKTNYRQLVLKSPHVPKPIHYRHAWARNPMTNLKSKEGIPLPTMRSDSWVQSELYETYVGKPSDTPGELHRNERRALRAYTKVADNRRLLKEAQMLVAEHNEKHKNCKDTCVFKKFHQKCK